MTALERTIEARGLKLLARHGLTSIKHGKNGWPDRQILLGENEHVWWEVKAPFGRLTKAQKVRLKWLTEVVGDRVLTGTDTVLESYLEG
jgi:hypothetical protein